MLSLQVAVVATVIGVAIGVPAALCLARYRFPGREPLGNLLLLPLVVPGIVLGTSLYVFHVEATILTELPILGSIAALVAGHILLVIPWSVRLVSASLAGFDRSIEEAAQNLGATPMTTFFRITLPTIRPGHRRGGAVRLRGVVRQSRDVDVPGRRRPHDAADHRSCSTSNTASIRRSRRCRCCRSC